MSRSSFPLPEHATCLRERIAQRLQSHPIPLELTDRGLDHYRCCYRFGIRRPSEGEWTELSIHFQIAERLEKVQSSDELSRILDLFLERHFAFDEVR